MVDLGNRYASLSFAIGLARIIWVAICFCALWWRLAHGQCDRLRHAHWFYRRRILERPFVQAAHALGVGRTRLIFRHILPNSLPVMLTYVGSQAGMAVVAYASLAFIGLGADPSKPDWGSMLFEYRMFIFDYPMLMIWPSTVIAVTTALLDWIFDPEKDVFTALQT